jgi:hypothetical protein
LVFKIIDKHIYSPDGSLLKKMFCAKRAGLNDLSQQDPKKFSCALCEKVVHNTDFFTEEQLVALMRSERNACLYIRKGNPMFKVEEWK